MRRLLIATAFVLFGSGLAVSAQAATDADIEKTLSSIPVEKIVGQMLASIDTKAVAQAIEKAAQDVAAGKTPEVANTPAMQELQAKMQTEMQTLAPELIRSMAGLIGPLVSSLLAELKTDLATR